MARFKIALLLLFSACIVRPGSAQAVRLAVGRPFCHAVTGVAMPDAAVVHLAVACAGEPDGYRTGSLWLRTPAGWAPGARRLLLIHSTRFDRLSAFFFYRDGRIVQQTVRRGNYGSRWRVGGLIAFEAPARDAPLSAIALRLDGLTSHHLLRVRLLPPLAGGNEAGLMAVLVGGALTLLLGGMIYTFFLAWAVRQASVGWHSAWAACLLLWGLLWSQLALIALPGLAGMTGVKISAALACLAIFTATASTVTAIGRDTLPRPLRRITLALGAICGLMGPAALLADGWLDLFATILGIASVTDIALVALCMAFGWRRGSPAARDLALSWGLPMATLAASEIFDFDNALFGGGSQIAVLIASGLQILWLSIATTRRLGRLRIERDAARAAEIELAELAQRDPLTGLLNRRGFVERTRRMIAQPGAADLPVGLLLIDVDEFKSINDSFGHEVGDTVLANLATCLKRWEAEGALVGRLGGEEFLLGVAGLSPDALARLADAVRLAMGACDHGAVSRQRRVTVSIGVAQGNTAMTFQKLYGLADRALYEAKRSGRDRVVMHDAQGHQWGRATIAPDQHQFRWEG